MLAEFEAEVEAAADGSIIEILLLLEKKLEGELQSVIDGNKRLMLQALREYVSVKIKLHRAKKHLRYLEYGWHDGSWLNGDGAAITLAEINVDRLKGEARAARYYFKHYQLQDPEYREKLLKNGSKLPDVVPPPLGQNKPYFVK
jgi:hypothetical protein